MVDSHRVPVGRIVVVMIVLAVAGVAAFMVSLAGPGSAVGASPGEDPIRLQVEVLEDTRVAGDVHCGRRASQRR